MSDWAARREDVEAVDRLVGLSNELSARWQEDRGPDGSDSERLPFVEISTVSRYLIELVNSERWDEVSRFSAEIERMFAEDRFENILQVRLLESIQNTTRAIGRTTGVG